MIVLQLNEKIKIRPLIFADLNNLKKIRDSVLDKIHNSTSFSLKQTQEWFLCERPYYLSIFYDNDYMGYFRLSNFKTNSCYVGLDLKKSYRGKGYGFFLYIKILEELNKIGINFFLLKVKKNNDIAIKLYEKIGFTLSNKNKIDADDFLFELDLSKS